MKLHLQPYSRQPLKPGNGLFCRTKFDWRKPATLANCMIRVGTRNFDHVAIYFEKADGTAMVAEMRFGIGYCETPLLEWLKMYDREIYFSSECCPVDLIQCHDGKKYDTASAFWAMPVLILTGHWIGRKNIADRKLFCFELYALAHQKENWWSVLPKIAS